MQEAHLAQEQHCRFVLEQVLLQRGIREGGSQLRVQLNDLPCKRAQAVIHYSLTIMLECGKHTHVHSQL